MKKLTKIKLVNWHLFSNQTINISDNTLISGENGSGKSTLLDALQYLLVGGRSGAKFNIAATDDAKRTLEGYVRGRIGAEEKEYLRENDVITHLALEFYDVDEEKYSIIGAILDLPKNATLKERFYLLEGISVHDNLFLDGNFPRDYRSMRDYLKAIGHELETFDTQKAYRDSLAKFFGMDARKYAKILPKALAFRPIDLQAFIFEFLLDDDPIDIRSLRNNVEQLKKVEMQIIKDREKLEKLDGISNLGEQISDAKNQLITNEIINQLNWVEQREKFIKDSENMLIKVDQKLEALREDKAKVDIEIEENDGQILNLERAKDNDDVERTMSQYKEAFRKKTIEYENQKELLQELKYALQNEFEVSKELLSLITIPALKDFVAYYQGHEDNLNHIEMTNHLTLVANEVQSYLQAYHTEKDKAEQEKQRLSNEIFYAQQRLSQLKKHIKTYPRNVQSLIEALNDGLSDHYQKEIKVQPLAELIEVNDEKWRNALEGYLSTQKFNLIVEPEYFDLALKIYDEVKTELEIYGVGLVNTQKLGEYAEVDSSSLASKVDTDYRHARNYVNMLLNNVITVEKASELKNFPRSITPSCMTYSNYTARQINPRSYSVPYIGSSATEMQIGIEIEDLERLEKEMDKFQEMTNNHGRIMRLLNSSKASPIVHQNHLRLFADVKETRREYTYLEEQINELSNSPSVAKFENQLEIERNKKRQLRMDSDKIVGDIASVRDERQRILDAIDEIKVKLVEYNESQDELSRKYPERLSIAHTQFYALKQRFGSSNTAITDSLAKDNVALNGQIGRGESELTNLMRMYVREYFFASEPNYEHLDEFVKEANIIRNNNLVKYEHEATELRRNSEIGFKEEFVNKLRASIEAAQQQIEDLNVALEGKMFGMDSYRLVYKASDNPEFRVYYDMIMNDKTFASNELFTEGLTKKNEQILMELFEKIASPNPEHDKLNYLFLDYRNYMSYDIEVTNINGNKSFFSKVSREKSGGETQVPFYIVIAASFQQLLSRNKRINSGCIVLFDEAFNNMDESRIDAMMKFYSSLSIQLLIAVPPQRVANIINYVNTSLVIVKENDYAIIESFKDHRELLLDDSADAAN
ncbi:MAG: SbcC/MukB-like Walker B domain-containing protein [Acholeplasma sp.]|nr:SbcC/MukB-like Walker B domain-containing protein [Acholeplasma sp.]